MNPIILQVLLASRLIAAFYSNIADCDEVFNYWEPTHFLQHGHGLQTWEYSPLYSIRSWAYVSMHATLGRLFMLLASNKVQVFYAIRAFLGIVSALTEYFLCTRIEKAGLPMVAQYLAIFLAFSTGMFISATSYLPSTFAMYFVTLAFAFSLTRPSFNRTGCIVGSIAMASILGWPFAGAVGIPLAFEDIFIASKGFRKAMSTLLAAVVWSVLSLVAILGPVVMIDQYYYDRLTVVPWNIVMYNVLSSGEGPNIFGTEPWWFYLLNGFLNFNVVFLAALASFLITAIATNFTALPARLLLKLIPMYLWLAVFTLQPHKEERFLYVVYPLICFNASLSLESIRLLLPLLPSRLLRTCVRAIVFLFVSAFVLLSVSRTYSLVENYHAPLDVYGKLAALPVGPGAAELCVGKEWYRFPSHYFLPDGMRVRFLNSSFRGLLPKYFEAEGRLGTSLIPSGMNDKNLEETDRYVDETACDFIVDLNVPGTAASEEEPNYADSPNWRKMICAPFLDSTSSDRLARAFWMPFNRNRLVWGNYCLLSRNKRALPWNYI